MAKDLSTSMDLKEVKKISSRYKDIVYVWLKKMQHIVPSNDADFIINQLIQNLCLLYSDDFMDSKILSKVEQMILFDTVINQLCLAHGIAKWNLLFRVSRDKFDKDSFYSKCDGKGSIICVIHSEENSVFGGYKIRSDGNFQEEVQVFPVAYKGSKAIEHHQTGYLSFGEMRIDVDRFDHDRVKGYASAYNCYKYKLDKYQLNGESTCFYIKDIEVFQL